MPEWVTSLTMESVLSSSLVLLGFIGLLFVLSLIVPGKRQPGVKNRDGSQVTYTLNGFAIFLTMQHHDTLPEGVGSLVAHWSEFLPLDI